MGRNLVLICQALLASALAAALLFPEPARAADADSNGIDDAAEVALARRFCPTLALHGPDTALHSLTVPVYPVPVEIMGLGGARPGEGLTADRLFVLWRAQPLDYPYGDHWVRANGWSPPLPESDPSHDYALLRDDPADYRHTAPPAMPFGPYTLRFHWEYGNPAVNEPNEWYDVWQNGNAWSRPGSDFPATVYAHLCRCAEAGCAFPAGSILIQYWFFFPFNDWINNHEGDWEGMNVIASSDDPAIASLLDCEYFAHRVNMTRRPGTPLAEHCLVLDGTHPVAFIGGHGYEEGCTGGVGQGEASHGFYPTSGRFEEVGEGDFIGCFDRADEEVAVSAGPTVHWSDLEIEVIPNPETINTALEPERAWLAADLLWGTRRVPSVGGELWEDVGNYAPHGPAHNPEGRWGRVAAHTSTRPYSSPQDPHSLPYRPADLGWVPFAFRLDTFTRMTANEAGTLDGWTIGSGNWTIAGGALVGVGDGTASLTNRAFYRSDWPPTDYSLPFLSWNPRAARFAADIALLQPLADGEQVGLLVAGAEGRSGDDQIRIVLGRTPGMGPALEIRRRRATGDSLIARASISDPGSSVHRLEALTLAPASGGLFHDVWYDGALLLQSIATPGAPDEARGLLADGGARSRFDRVSFSGLRLESRFHHPPFAAFTTAPASGADIYGCPQLLAWMAVDEKTDSGITEQEVTLSTDGGTSWQLVAHLDGESRSLTWLPPQVLQPAMAQLRLDITDVDGDLRTITSSSFWLRPGPAPVALLVPAGGEVWYRSTLQTIHWSVPCQGPVDLSLSTDGGVTFPHIIAGSTPNDGAYDWLIPDYLPAGGRCRVRLSSADFLPAESRADFSILWDGQLAGGDFEHAEPWSLDPIVERALGPASTAYGIGRPPLGLPLAGEASLFAHTRADGIGRDTGDAAYPARAELELVVESERIPVSALFGGRSLHFHLRARVEVDESSPAAAAASADIRLEAVYRDTEDRELEAREIATARVFRDTPGSLADSREAIAPLPSPPADASVLRLRLHLAGTSDAAGHRAMARSQALADELWFAIAIAVPPGAVDPATDSAVPGPAIRVDPNPAAIGDEVRIAFATPRTGTITLALYDVGGRRVTALQVPSTSRGVRWTPNGLLPAGIYFWRLEAPENTTAVCKWSLVR